MSAQMECRRTGATLPDLFEWMIPDFAVPTLRSGAHSIRIEEGMKDGEFTLNAELPGIDPDKDVEISVEGDMLTIRSERSERTESKATQSSTTASSPGPCGSPRCAYRRGQGQLQGRHPHGEDNVAQPGSEAKKIEVQRRSG
ncbi:hypothetical protein GCM10012287_56650 [Streptomyces daqingensis]|uniref:SHSP domain-containing protein n=1 Tax=Streptomyces daqingensis TaxID=1472640 RepID=A0ABQ2MTE7_9ACTN|nr:Hsp20/alpha crystallin family protein [Streptomyces daqingensis]GGO58455.1 hypothetical protein GCM10012287_56650 [Streptomyces daqingensis]